MAYSFRHEPSVMHDNAQDIGKLVGIARVVMRFVRLGYEVGCYGAIVQFAWSPTLTVPNVTLDYPAYCIP